jgi:hypothetical protein
MQLQHVWQTAYNRIFGFRKIIVRIYFHAYNRISVGGGFTGKIKGDLGGEKFKNHRPTRLYKLGPGQTHSGRMLTTAHLCRHSMRTSCHLLPAAIMTASGTRCETSAVSLTPWRRAHPSDLCPRGQDACTGAPFTLHLSASGFHRSTKFRTNAVLLKCMRSNFFTLLINNICTSPCSC